MHFTIDYSKMSAAEKQAKAVADAKKWLNEAQYNALKEIASYKDTDIKSFRMAASFTGMQGFPVDALWKHFGREA